MSTHAPLVQVVYVSSATQPFSPEDLNELLRHSRARNAADGITGMLLYRSGNFIQAVEGPEAAIDRLLARIARDKRHQGLITIIRQPVAGRSFGDWSMGFDDLSDEAAAADQGFTDFLRRMDAGPVGPADSNFALRMLERFKQNIR